MDVGETLILLLGTHSQQLFDPLQSDVMGSVFHLSPKKRLYPLRDRTTTLSLWNYVSRGSDREPLTHISHHNRVQEYIGIKM